MATSSSTSISKDTPLRKRMRVLERAQSLTSLNKLDGKPLDINLKHNDTAEDVPHISYTDYETISSSSDDEGGAENREEASNTSRTEHAKPQRPTLDTKGAYHYSRNRSERSESSPMSPKSRAWYEFDLAVVVALVSPIGNWLTGGDHVKNLLLIVLLIFYLHQVIEVPWRLYHKCRPHRRAEHIPPSGALADSTSKEAQYAQLAASELQKFEFLFLFLTFLSPFLGAALLRYATDAILGPDAVSWFSTGLFVLATGMRPWIHLVERLNERTDELHDFVHYPSPSHSSSEERQKLLEDRVAQLEKSLLKMKTKVNHATEDVYDYVDDAVDAVEHAIRKQDRRWDKFEGKIKDVERVVVQLSSKASAQPNLLSKTISIDLCNMKAYTRYLLAKLVPDWIIHPQKMIYSSYPEDPTANIMLTKKVKKRSISGSSSPSPCVTPLETIVEESAEYVEDPVARSSLLARPSYITSALIYRTGYIMTAPLRAVLRMILRKY
ncbi:hypothetical protein JR316_0010627 [Psilocybe cubensis]|uniref:Uncharacterized protein n=3 Tax=Psilocybe cubensis TaxID=181762 RepID=A0A8H7XJ79_PSICU|nr:hypothetical protein JR316_0010506 [Psilocybe cubensis]XP_047744338.1 hypothetical protein JR316_0010627 [Psilocybe cubensis]KAH9476594.1 hypothetical protein JR316_0010506 [Psilocybe cubensis]KAH9476713.1 hypothetical protein JR316_0010627 [Psilocybe cubensis]